MTPEIRAFKSVAEDANGCWIFLGARTKAGYGMVGRGRRGEGNVYVHRLMYEAFRGPIPDGLHLDHLCRVRECCNPDHLEAVTQAENNRRAREAQREAVA